MVSIILDGSTYAYIVDTLFSETSDVSEPEFLNQGSTPQAGVTLDENVWNKGPFKVTYVMRVTSEQKWVLDQLLHTHGSINLTDATYGINDNAFVTKIEAEWNPNNHNYPWTLTVDLVLIQ